jgi:hypothetical protein
VQVEGEGMSDRRDFLRSASLLSVVAASGSEASDTKAEPAADTAPRKPGGHDHDPIPDPAPVRELSFTNYHLLGNPARIANLLGPQRPHTWKATKAELKKALQGAAQPQDPIHEWLKTFDQTFDERSAKIVLDATTTLQTGYGGELVNEPQLYDGLLRSAAALLDRCLRYRLDMGGFELAGVNSGIGYLAFVKLKPLQHNFIIQCSTADIAEIEEAAQGAASERFQHARGLDRLFEKYHLQGLHFASEGNSVEARQAAAKDRLRTELLERQFEIQVDAQLAQFTRLLTSGSTSNYAERYLRTLSLLTEDLADAYRKLFCASKGIQQVLSLTKVTVGNGTPIDVDIPRFTNLQALVDWVHQIVPDQGDQRQPDVLDAMVLWARAVMRELDRRAQKEAEFTVAIPLNQPWGKSNAVLVSPDQIAAAFTGGSPTGKITFTLTSDALPFPALLEQIRIVGVGLSVEHSMDDASPVQYSGTFPKSPQAPTPPGPNVPSDDQIAAVRTFEKIRMARLNATITTPQQTAPGVGTYSRPTLFLSNVRIQGGSGGDLEPALSLDPGSRNASPFGAWTITIDRNALEFYQSAGQLPDDWIAGLVLHLRLRASVARVAQ